MHHIYALECPIEGVVRYIGKSDWPEKRLQQHIYEARYRKNIRNHRTNWLSKVVDAGLEPRLIPLCTLQDGSNWAAVETILIGFARHCEFRIVNETAGGEGMRVASDDLHKRLSDGAKERIRRPGVLDVFVAGTKAAWADEKKRAARIESMVAAANRPEVKAKLAEVKLRTVGCPITKEKRRVATEKTWQDPEIRARRMDSFTEDVRRRQSEKRIAYFAIPENVKKQSDSRKKQWADPELKQAMLAKRVEMWADPVQREALIAKQKLAWEKRKANKLAKDAEASNQRTLDEYAAA